LLPSQEINRFFDLFGAAFPADECPSVEQTLELVFQVLQTNLSDRKRRELHLLSILKTKTVLGKLPSRLGVCFAAAFELISVEQALVCDQQLPKIDTLEEKLHAQKKTLEAVKLLQQDFLLDMAILLGEKRLFQNALDLVDVVIAQNPDRPKAHSARAVFLANLGRHLESLTAYELSIDLEPSNPTTLTSYTRKLISLNRLDVALSFLETDAMSYVEEEERFGLVIEIFCIQRRYLEAAVLLSKCCEIKPASSQYYIRLANVLSAQGRFEDAHKVLERCPSSDNAAAALAKADLLLSQGQSLKAFASLLSHTDHKDCDFNTIIRLSELAILHGRFFQAAKTIAALNPRTVDEHILKINVCAELALAKFQPSQAASILQEVLGICSKIPPENFGYIRLLETALRMHLMRPNPGAARTISREIDRRLRVAGNELARSSMRETFSYRLLKEFSTDPHSEHQLEKIVAQPEFEFGGAVYGLIAQDHDFIPACCAMLVAARGKGAFQVFPKVRPRIADPVRSTIPRRIVQFWDSEVVPSDVAQIMKSWPLQHPNFDYVVFNDGSAEAFIRERCSQKIMEAFQIANHPAMRSDIFRLAYLSVLGGIYVDADDYCQTDTTSLISDEISLLLVQEQIGTIGNNLIAAAPEHPWLRAAADFVADRVIEREGDFVWSLTGPGAITLSFCRYYLADFIQRSCPEDIRVLTVYDLNEYVCPHIKLNYKNDHRDWASYGLKRGPLFLRHRLSRALKPIV